MQVRKTNLFSFGIQCRKSLRVQQTITVNRVVLLTKHISNNNKNNQIKDVFVCLLLNLASALFRQSVPRLVEI